MIAGNDFASDYRRLADDFNILRAAIELYTFARERTTDNECLFEARDRVRASALPPVILK